MHIALTTFSDFGLAEPIQRAVAELGYVTPTPIQEQAIPVVLQNRDVMGAAQTGTGKTAGFALPILQRLMRHANSSASPARHPVRSLILAPTRELADQIYENVRDYAKYSGLRSAVVFGGVDIKPQIAALRQGCEVLVATPGRLLDHVGQKTVNLSQVEVLVLDEADRMLDMGFLPDIQRIIQLLPKQRQNLMFSATFSGEIRKLAESFLNDPQLIEVARRNATAENVEQRVYRVADADAKRGAVARLIRDHSLEQVIVFSNTKIGAGRLARQLERDGLNASAIHGDKSQQERLATLEGFKRGDIKVLVATDVAARGLDIAELPAVINYDLPYSPEDYVHRIGRTGRAGASGMALSLMLESDGRLLGAIEGLIKRKLEPTALDVPRQPREGRPRRDLPEARPRRERPTRREGGSSVGLSNDPFFYKPYEPAPSAADAGDSGRPDAMAPGRQRAQRPGRAGAPVAALLGGLRRAG
ncbi:MAG: DEAD/DEAH box helicase [Burkholderiaceae bacterium]|nr:DEAD/DEAH box helicase [Burkholderiaceae bacterium]MEB2319123.1 DEAD/DEAH box helicase [Pseudomonadota bacterium]